MGEATAVEHLAMVVGKFWDLLPVARHCCSIPALLIVWVEALAEAIQGANLPVIVQDLIMHNVLSVADSLQLTEHVLVVIHPLAAKFGTVAKEQFGAFNSQLGGEAST